MQLSGNIFDYFIVFWGGVLVSLTPCVYPVIPLTAGFIAGINTKGTKLMGFLISLVYVFGMALTYCAMAVFAALTGKIFGQLQNHPAVLILVGCLLAFFSLVMFGVVSIPAIGISFHDKIKTKNIWTVLLFGMASGLVVGPCTAPVLGTLLVYIGKKQNLWHGISLMFTFAYGVGASLIVVGTFSAILARLPKSGRWLLRIKQFCGLILACAALLFFYKSWKLIVV